MIESQTAPELETLTETGHFLRASVIAKAEAKTFGEKKVGEKGLRSPDVLPHARMHFLGQALGLESELELEEASAAELAVILREKVQKAHRKNRALLDRLYLKFKDAGVPLPEGTDDRDLRAELAAAEARQDELINSGKRAVNSRKQKVFDLKKQKELSEHDLRNFVDAQRLSSMDVQQAVQTAAKDKHQTQNLSRDVERLMGEFPSLPNPNDRELGDFGLQPTITRLRRVLYRSSEEAYRLDMRLHESMRSANIKTSMVRTKEEENLPKVRVYDCQLYNPVSKPTSQVEVDMLDALWAARSFPWQQFDQYSVHSQRAGIDCMAKELAAVTSRMGIWEEMMRVVSTLSRSPDFDTAGKIFLDLVPKLLNADGALFFVVGQDRAWCRSPPRGAAPHLFISLDPHCGPIGVVSASQETLNVDDAMLRCWTPEMAALFPDTYRLQAMVCIPLLRDQVVVAVIMVFNKLLPRGTFDEDEEEILRVVGSAMVDVLEGCVTREAEEQKMRRCAILQKLAEDIKCGKPEHAIDIPPADGFLMLEAAFVKLFAVNEYAIYLCEKDQNAQVLVKGKGIGGVSTRVFMMDKGLLGACRKKKALQVLNSWDEVPPYYNDSIDLEIPPGHSLHVLPWVVNRGASDEEVDFIVSWTSEQPERPELDSSNFNAADEDHIYKISVWMDLAYSFIKLHFPMETRQNKAPSPYAKQTSEPPPQEPPTPEQPASPKGDGANKSHGIGEVPPSAVIVAGRDSKQAVNIQVDAKVDTKLKMRKARTSIYLADAEAEETQLSDELPGAQDLAHQRWGAIAGTIGNKASNRKRHAIKPRRSVMSLRRTASFPDEFGSPKKSSGGK
jgi:hypothetical protein